MENTNTAREGEIATTVEMYVSSRLKSKRPVSTADAIVAIRTALPRCDLDDRALAELVATSAIRNRQDVIFEMPEGSGKLS